ncbi:MAG: hypothetical protein R3B82_13130 [Sandaracinaceae bacterium]
MTMLLSGSDAPLPRWLAPAWCGGAGYVMGLSALSTILASEHFDPNGPLGLLAVGLAPGLLSAAGGWVGSRLESPFVGLVVTIMSSLAASVLCAPLTWVLLAVTGGNTQVGSMVGGGSALGVLTLVTIIGAFVAAPLGVFFGVLYGAVVALVQALRRRPARGARDLALFGLGLGATAIGVASAYYLVRVHPGAVTYAPSEIPWIVVGLAVIYASVGAVAALLGGALLILRHGHVALAQRGRRAGWTVVDLESVDDASSLPRLFPFGAARRVLVRQETAEVGPFRSGDTATALARV